MKALLFILLISPHYLNFEPLEFLVIWNVGQGQWVSHLKPSECWHFDAGGSSSAFLEIKAHCSSKKNLFFLSHLDLDHINGLKNWSRKNACIVAPGLKKIQSVQKRKWLTRPTCQLSQLKEIQLQTFEGSTSNDNAHVYLWNQWLFTGDLSKNKERLIKNEFTSRTKFLIAGHHGSKTSSDQLFISKLENLKQVIISAKYRRYGHPHFETIKTFKDKKIPQLRTEDWGSIIYQIR